MIMLKKCNVCEKENDLSQCHFRGVQYPLPNSGLNPVGLYDCECGNTMTGPEIRPASHSETNKNSETNLES